MHRVGRRARPAELAGARLSRAEPDPLRPGSHAVGGRRRPAPTRAAEGGTGGLTEAAAVFADLGAVPWAERAARQVARIGGRTGQADALARDRAASGRVHGRRPEQPGHRGTLVGQPPDGRVELDTGVPQARRSLPKGNGREAASDLTAVDPAMDVVFPDSATGGMGHRWRCATSSCDGPRLRPDGGAARDGGGRAWKAGALGPNADHGAGDASVRCRALPPWVSGQRLDR